MILNPYSHNFESEANSDTLRNPRDPNQEVRHFTNFILHYLVLLQRNSDLHLIVLAEICSKYHKYLLYLYITILY